MNMKIAFICVNFNNHEVTLNYISNVLSVCNDHEVKIIVVDNASEMGDIIALESGIENDEVILIKSRVNGGYFNGLNQGIAWAVNSGFKEYLIIGNNDIEFENGFLEKLTNLPLMQDELVIAPDVITNTGIHENPHVIKRVSQIRKVMYAIYYSNYFIAQIIMAFYSNERKPKPFDPVKKHIYMGIGALYILTPHFFKHFDKLWDYLFLYGEEAVFGAQIESVNGKIVYEPSLKCYHNESATTSKLMAKSKYEIVRRSYRIYKKYL